LPVFEFLWACNRLETFTLSGVAFNRHDDHGDYTGDTYELFMRDPDDMGDTENTPAANEDTRQPDADAGAVQSRKKLLPRYGWFSIIPPGTWGYDDMTTLAHTTPTSFSKECSAVSSPCLACAKLL
jgi:hypothetical protein